MTIRNTRYAEPIARLTPIDVSVPKEVWAEAATVQRPALRVTTSRGLGDTGTFVAVIGATGPPTPAESYAVFSIVDIRSEPTRTTPSCSRLPFYPAAPEVLPLGPVTRQLFDKKAANPAQTRFSIGASTVSHKDGWIFIIDKANVPLRRDQALVVYDNTSAELQSVWTYNSDNCAGATQNMIVAPFMRDQMTISRADATTMVLGDPDRGDIAVFSEPNFWSLFGGRRVTISRVYPSRN